MANLLSDAKKQQVIALGQLGWTLRRIEAATGVRHETAGAYLKAAGLAVRPPGRWGHPPKPAIEVSTESAAAPPTSSTWPPRPQRAPAASACEPYRDLIELAVARGRNAVAIWRDLVDDHGFPSQYASVRRFVGRLRGPQTAEAHPIIITAPGEEGQVDYGDGPMVRHPSTRKYRRTRLFVFTLGYSRKSVRLLTFTSSTRRWAELHEASFRRLGGSVAGRGARQSPGRRPHCRHLRPRPEPALSRCPRPLRRRRAALSRRRSGSQRQSGVGHRPHADRPQRPALRDARGGAGLSRSLGRALGRHAHPRHHQAAGRHHVRRGAAHPS